jgi:hypothetical protein
MKMRRIKVWRSSITVLLLTVGAMVGPTFAQTKDGAARVFPGQATECDDLVKLSPPDVTITLATNVPAGQFTPPGSVNPGLPACRRRAAGTTRAAARL